MKVRLVAPLWGSSVAYGGEHSALLLACELSRAGHEVTVLASDTAPPASSGSDLPGAEAAAVGGPDVNTRHEVALASETARSGRGGSPRPGAEAAARGAPGASRAGNAAGEGPRVLRLPMKADALATPMRGADVVHVYDATVMDTALRAARRARVAAVISANSYWATCLFGDMTFPDGSACPRCHVAGVGRDYRTRNPLTVGRRLPALPLAAVAGRLVVARRTRTLGRFERVLALSEAARRRLVRAGVEPARIGVVPNMADRAALIDPLEPLTEEPHVLFVGALKHTKGADVLLRAALDLRRDVTGLRVTLAGHGPEEARLRDRARNGALDDVVRFAGYQSHDRIASLYGHARVLALPVIWEEPFGRVVLEAWSRGIPVVGSALGGPGELIEHGVSGLLVPPGDSAALAAALAEVLRDPALAAALREGGRRAVEAYRPEAILPRLLAEYEHARAAAAT